MSHPSRLAVDRLALGEASPEVEAHLSGCAECRAHFEAVRAQLPVPAWVKDAATPPRRAWWRPLVLAASLATVLLVVLLRPPPPPETTAKGFPAVTVWFKRGELVSTWDGTSPLRGGDAVRFEAVPAGYGWVTVVAESADGGLVTLFAAKLDPSGKPTLTPAWQLDAHGTQEHLAVLFTRDAVRDAHVPSLLSRRDAEAWCIHEVLPKEAP